MNRNIWQITLCAACVCAGAFSGRAASLKRADVIANPAWLLHLDCDSLGTGAIGQYIKSEIAKPETSDKLAAFQTIFGFDLRTQLHGITLYGASGVPEDGVMILYADFDSNRLVTLAKGADDYKSSTHNQHPISNWLDKDKAKAKGGKPRVYAAIQGNRVIFGQREGPVAKALDVIDGTAPNMASGNAFPLLGLPASGHSIEAAASKTDLLDSDKDSAIWKLSQSIQLVLGEAQQNLQGSVTLVTDSPDVAVPLTAIVNGVAALMKLDKANPDSVAIGKALTVTQNGPQVTASLTLPADRAVEMMKAGAARKAAQKK